MHLQYLKQLFRSDLNESIKTRHMSTKKGMAFFQRSSIMMKYFKLHFIKDMENKMHPNNSFIIDVFDLLALDFEDYVNKVAINHIFSEFVFENILK